MSTKEVLDQINDAISDWEVGPDAMRCGAPEAARASIPQGRRRVAHPGMVLVNLTVDTTKFVQAIRRRTKGRSRR
ncbi:hypothetical protein EFK50_01170 [Nocardioides marmoriginsengisoli]|uniref:Uncharacterized protein n=1 Tax=Nocardioides marmoriginsengisoli TaxID=661483 RepID=A0A3N0CS34_9ACTN|nr:hypothetical protein [Nocardioides marmoriginsengisoli]RNL66267.1 hypothetical protein EFK50_01170 [Nocardioides marmoriginsengisoli]